MSVPAYALHVCAITLVMMGIWLWATDCEKVLLTDTKTKLLEESVQSNTDEKPSPSPVQWIHEV